MESSKLCSRGWDRGSSPARPTTIPAASPPIPRRAPGEGFGLLWTVVLTWPLMVAVQSVSARIGRVTGRGLAGNMVKVFPRSVVTLLVLLLFVANTINLGADLAAMGAAGNAGAGGQRALTRWPVAIASLLAIVFVPYQPLCRPAEVVHLLAAGLCRRGLHREDRLAGGGGRRLRA